MSFVEVFSFFLPEAVYHTARGRKTEINYQKSSRSFDEMSFEEKLGFFSPPLYTILQGGKR